MKRSDDLYLGDGDVVLKHGSTLYKVRSEDLTDQSDTLSKLLKPSGKLTHRKDADACDVSTVGGKTVSQEGLELILRYIYLKSGANSQADILFMLDMSRILDLPDTGDELENLLEDEPDDEPTPQLNSAHSKDLYFGDGDAVLRHGSTFYKMRSEPLTEQSDTFKQLLAPSGKSIHATDANACDVSSVRDQPVDKEGLELILRYIYGRAENPNMSFEQPDVLLMLDMSRVLDLPDTGDELMNILSEEPDEAPVNISSKGYGFQMRDVPGQANRPTTKQVIKGLREDLKACRASLKQARLDLISKDATIENLNTQLKAKPEEKPKPELPTDTASAIDLYGKGTFTIKLFAVSDSDWSKFKGFLSLKKGELLYTDGLQRRGSSGTLADNDSYIAINARGEWGYVRKYYVIGLPTEP